MYYFAYTMAYIAVNRVLSEDFPECGSSGCGFSGYGLSGRRVFYMEKVFPAVRILHLSPILIFRSTMASMPVQCRGAA